MLAFSCTLLSVDMFIYDTAVFLFQVQFRYKAVQALISHLDKGNPKIDNPSAKCGILDTVSQCIGVGSEGFLGPSAMDAFTKLLKHLKKSLDNCSIRVANVEVMVSYLCCMCNTVYERVWTYLHMYVCICHTYV